MNRHIAAIIAFAMMTGPAFADTINVGKGLVMEIPVQEGWTIYQEPPSALVEETAEHISHEAKAQGANPEKEKLLMLARKRLAANEAILYHELSGAHLDIDFSPLDTGEKPPQERNLRDSAKYAVQSLEGEEGVTDVVWDVERMKIEGAEDAFVLSASYKHHEQPVRFLGVIGFAAPQWFFFYYTDYGKAADTFEGMQQMLDAVVIRSAGN